MGKRRESKYKETEMEKVCTIMRVRDAFAYEREKKTCITFRILYLY